MFIQWAMRMFEFVSYMLQVFWPGQSSNASPLRPRCDVEFAPAFRGLEEYPEDEVGICSCDACIEAFKFSIDSRRTYWRRPDQLGLDVPHNHPGWRYQPRMGWLFNSWLYSADEPDAEADAADPQGQMPAQEPAQEYTAWDSAAVTLRMSPIGVRTMSDDIRML